MLWGTDSIWYGSPQDQIQAFRTFQISPDFATSSAIRRSRRSVRAKVFGLNALKVYRVSGDVLKKHLPRDRVALDRRLYREEPDPAFLTYGPRTRREFLNLQAWGRAPER